MIEFFNSLLQSGRPVLDPGGLPNLRWIQEEISIHPDEFSSTLERLYHQESLSFPGEPPQFRCDAAFWGLSLFFKASCSYSFRELSPEAIARLFDSPPPNWNQPESHYSADLVLRHLPQLLNLTRSLADGDPLVVHLDLLSNLAPFSCPLAGDPNPKSVETLLSHSGLSQLWCERLIEVDSPLVYKQPFLDKIKTLAGNYSQEILPPNFSLLTSSS